MTAAVKGISVRRAQALDLRAQERFGVPAATLMENAGRQVAEELLRVRACRRPAIVCGTGNNGADGLVAARHLLVRGIRPRVFLAGDPQKLTGLPGAQRAILDRLRLKISPVDPAAPAGLRGQLRFCDCIVDALLGIGLAGEVRGIYRTAIEAINAARTFVLAVDIPSGMDADTGRICGVCVRADVTVTFIAPKRGMQRRQATGLCGRIVVADIGVPLLKA